MKKTKNSYTENVIKKSWSHIDRVYISCICLTYNQEMYIQETIERMLAQKCDYRFEIIIHDDCSTDGTRDILIDYQKKYPNIIKLVLQEENQYSQGKKITPLAIPYASGKYIALCEGDDFWIDEYKIQKQIDELEKNPAINLVISRALSLFSDNTTDYFCDLGEVKKNISFEDCILGPDKDFFPTATFFFRKKIMKKLPDWFYSLAPVGDYYIQLFASYNQGCIYLPDITAVYRRNSEGSWSNVMELNLEKNIDVLSKKIICNSLIANTLALTKLERKALAKRKTLYLKDKSFSYLKKRKFYLFTTNFIKAIKTNCIYLFKLCIKSFKNKMKKK